METRFLSDVAKQPHAQKTSMVHPQERNTTALDGAMVLSRRLRLPRSLTSASRRRVSSCWHGFSMLTKFGAALIAGEFLQHLERNVVHA